MFGRISMALGAFTVAGAVSFLAVGAYNPGTACAQGAGGDCGLARLSYPEDAVENQLQSLLASAKTSVFCSVGGIGNARFVKMFEDHKSRGLDVRILEFRTAPAIGDFRTRLERAQVPVMVRQHEVAQNDKFCIVDGGIVVTGDWAWEEPEGTVQPDVTVTIFRDCETVSRRYRDIFEFMAKPRPGEGPESAKGQP